MTTRRHEPQPPEPQSAHGGADPRQLIADLEEQLAERTRESQQNFERLQRAVADLENYKRRSQQESQERARYANEELMLRLLPVLDNFRRAFDALGPEADTAWADGVRLVYRQLEDLLSSSGVEVIEAVGRPFDPAEHEAVGREPGPEGTPPDTVISELQRGYRLRGKLLRPALVKIAG